jgi:hypothetical protein
MARDATACDEDYCASAMEQARRGDWVCRRDLPATCPFSLEQILAKDFLPG